MAIKDDSAVVFHFADVGEPRRARVRVRAPYPWSPFFNSRLSVVSQKIQTITAADRDEPPGGQRFFFQLAPESTVKANFSVRDNGGELFPSLFALRPRRREVEREREALLQSPDRAEIYTRIPVFFADNTAGIYTRRAGFRRAQKITHLVAVVILDAGDPGMSSTGTLTVRVCSCDRDGNMEMCNTEARSGSAGLSTGALVAILLCVLILLREYHQEIRKRGDKYEDVTVNVQIRSPSLYERIRTAGLKVGVA